MGGSVLNNSNDKRHNDGESVSRVLANWVHSVNYDEIPTNVIKQTKFRVLDIVGAMLGGMNLDLIAQVRSATRLSQSSDCLIQVPGCTEKTDLQGATILMGTMGCVLEYDDSHLSTGIHASTPIVATSIALGQQLGSSGKELIQAVLVGNELTCRLGVAAPGTFHRVGFHPTAVLSTFGSCYSATKLMKLPVDAIMNAIGICGSFSSGIMASWQDGTSAKSLHAGWSGAAGLSASHFASHGVSGPEEVYEGRFGFYKTHIQDKNYEVDYGSIFNNLGHHWEVLNIVPRAYPCGHYIQPYVAASLELANNNNLDIQNIVEIECLVPDYWVPLICEPRKEKVKPTTPWHARYSMQFCVAVSLINKYFDKNSLSLISLSNEDLLALTNKVIYSIDSTATDRNRWSGEIIISLKNGEKIRHRVDDLLGTPLNPMSEEDLINKFIHNASGVINIDAAYEFVENIFKLEKMSDVRGIFDPFKKG